MFWFKSWKKQMDTRNLVAGQVVEMVSRNHFGGEGTVIEITPWGVKIKLDEGSLALEFEPRKEVYSFNHHGLECHDDGTKKYGPWKLKLPDK